MPMLIPTLLVGAVLVASPAPQAPTSPPSQPPASDSAAKPADHGMRADGVAAADTAFIKKAAEGGMAEVALAKLAQTKASSADVKAYAQKLETDHSKANDELKTLAESKKVMVPAPKAESPAEAKLSKLSGAAFDRAYVAAMVTDHQKDIALFQKAAMSASDPELKAWAAKTLPTLKEHLQEVQQLSKTVGRAAS